MIESRASRDIGRIMASAPVIPVLVIDDVRDAVRIAEALVTGGLPVLEVTLRTEAALDAIRAMKSVQGAIVGAGTVTSEEDLTAALEAGSEFVVSPGLTDELGKAAARKGVPFLPGVANASDIMRGLNLGFTHFKFFPAVPSGGLSALKALAAPFSQCRFCPTGGIDPQNAREWLEFEPVLCVGGSWIAPQGSVEPAMIEMRAREASSLRSSRDLH